GVVQKISRRFARTADAGYFGQFVRLQVYLKTGLHNGGADGVVAAAGTERGNAAFVVGLGVAYLVFRQCRMVELWFYEGHFVCFLNG
ncbi:MAG: hypothetical protein JNL44_18425, partial [Gemmatimonadetes bacterium]|nr:hypothetical protein [Gemmatimonadota bacterium]